MLHHFFVHIAKVHCIVAKFPTVTVNSTQWYLLIISLIFLMHVQSSRNKQLNLSGLAFETKL